MLDFSQSHSVLIYNRPVDMRRAIDSLSILVSEQLCESPTSGRWYVFYNRGNNKLKILYWERNGFCLFYKRLEKHRFKLPAPGCLTVTLSLQQLRWLLEGLDITKVKGHERLNYSVLY